MRRSDREITDIDQVRGIVSRSMVMHMGLVDGDMPYVVAMNFGAQWQEDRLTLYAHCATQGRKLTLIEQHPTVCVQMDSEGALLPGTIACEYGYRYSSLVGTGKAVILTDPAEKQAGLAALMLHQTGKAFAFNHEDIESVAVLRITLDEWSAKAR